LVTHLFVESVTSASGEHAAKVIASKTATLRMKPPVLLAGSRARAGFPRIVIPLYLFV
jgi:hypothetical protein